MQKGIIITILFHLTLQADSIRMIIELYRHGARREWVDIKPVILKTDYPSKNTGLGDITPVGLKTHYLLGKSIYENYPKLFEQKEFDLNNIEIISSGQNRTLSSGIAQMMGIEVLGSGPKIENDVVKFYNPPFGGAMKKIDYNFALPNGYTIHPIRNSVEDFDFMFEVEKICPTFKEEQNKIMPILFNKYNSTFTPAYKILNKFVPPEKWIKKDSYDLESAFKICDYIITHIWNDPNYAYPVEIIEQCNYVYFFTVFLYSDIGNMRKTYLHRLGLYFLKKLKDNISGKTTPRVVFVSAHDSSIAAFLMALNPKNLQCIIDNYKQKFLFKNEFFSQEKNYFKNIVNSVSPKRKKFLKKFSIFWNSKFKSKQKKKNKFLNKIENIIKRKKIRFYNIDPKCVEFIKFSANLILELSEESGTFFITLKFNNQLLNFFNGKAKVSFEEFEDILKNKIIDNQFEQNCGNKILIKNQEHNAFFEFLCILSYLLITLFFVGLCFIYYKFKNREIENDPEILYFENSSLI